MLNLKITARSRKVANRYFFEYMVHPETTDADDGLPFKTAKDAESAAKAWIKANDKFARKELKAESKAVESAEKAAERATKSVQRAAEKAAEKLAAEQALLAEKKERLDAFLEAGTFALVG